jgi:N-acyl-D-amino-acid deacylase
MTLLLWAGALSVTVAWGETYDLVLRGGRIVDGTGNPAWLGDVGIKGGRIAAVGLVEGRANETLDVHGLIVAPGFIDAHTHADELTEQPLAENFVHMGVTTIIAGNCGDSARDIAKFFAAVQSTNVSVNAATLVGHSTIRRVAMGGSFDRPPTEAELACMKAMVGQAMEEGALGLSTGLIYPPGSFAKTEELVALAKVAAAHGGIYATHIRNEGTGILNSLEEVFRIAREAGIRAEVSHIKLAGKAAWGRAAQVIAALERARAEGLDITQDQYVYTASSTGLSMLIADKYLEGGKFKEHFANPQTKAAMVADMKRRLKERGYDDYGFAFIADYKNDRSLNGLNVPEAAKRKRGSSSLDDQVELVLEIQANGGATGIFHGISEDDLRQFMLHPNTAFACDSGLRKLGEGVPHPRGYGNNARVLAHYVRELNLLRLEDALRRMTSLPATVFRLKDRGLLREGAWADLVVFDPAKVQDNATYDDPHHYATGFAYVLVNGVPVVKADQHTGARPGQPLRHQKVN